MVKQFVSLILFLLLMVSCQSNKKPVIGLLLDQLETERWEKDKQYFNDKCRELGADVLNAVANSDPYMQIAQAKEMIRNKVDVLVIVPVDRNLTASIIDLAHKENIRVIAYDRLIPQCDLDFYISFDNIEVGKQQADYFIKHHHLGKYALINGPIHDNNSSLLHHGQLSALQSYKKDGRLEIVYDNHASDYTEEEGYKEILNCIRKNGLDVDVVIAGNDALARGILKGIYEYRPDKKILVAGQDAELLSLKSILANKQSITIYKPIRNIAEKAALVAYGLATGQNLIQEDVDFIDNNYKMVPSLILPTIVVDKDNMLSTVVADGFVEQDNLPLNIPAK